VILSLWRGSHEDRVERKNIVFKGEEVDLLTHRFLSGIR